MKTTENEQRVPDVLLTGDDFSFWARYTETSTEEMAELAGLSAEKTTAIMASADGYVEYLERAMGAYEASMASDHVWTPQDRADYAGMSLDQWRAMEVRGTITWDEYLAVYDVVSDLIDTKALAKMLAYGREHNVPGFEDAAPAYETAK